MRKLRERLTRSLHSDSGVSLVEVLVAIMVFTTVSVGIAYATVSALRMSRDAQSREVASNLAAGEIDSVRLLADPLTITSTTSTVTIDDIVYTIKRSASWVDSTGALSGCGDGSGTLQYKAVNVTVDWTGRLPTTRLAAADTIVAPDTRLNDPSTGTITVRVNGADGTGRSGVSVSGVATSGGAPVTFTSTDADGCSFAFQVTPGTYTISLSKSGYIDEAQNLTPSQTGVVVTAGASSSLPFQYDLAATYSLTYQVDEAEGSLMLPNNLQVAYLNSYGVWSKSGSPSSIQLHPYSTGYSVIAGTYVAPVAATDSTPAVPGCPNPDPGAWPAGTVSGDSYAAGERLPPVAAAPGGSASMVIPMGGIVVDNANNYYIRATLVSPLSGSADPGCSSSVVFTFDRISGNSKKTLALPYGTWELERRSNTYGSWSSIGSILDDVLGVTSSSGSKFTIDPRVKL